MTVHRLPPVFVDAAGWIAVVRRGDAVAWLGKLPTAGLGRAHTSDYVVAEAFSFIQRNHRREAALRFLEAVESGKFILHPSDADLLDRAMAEAREHSFQRELSLVDWTSALLMRDHGIQHILTTDRGFAQLGFNVLP
ncbi:MAG: PIN domain-containing protein [Halobacteriales archaeon]|nr:PIN domain-containing protein [Halobacteriales archaeon]